MLTRIHRHNKTINIKCKGQIQKGELLKWVWSRGVASCPGFRSGKVGNYDKTKSIPKIMSDICMKMQKVLLYLIIGTREVTQATDRNTSGLENCPPSPPSNP